MVNTSIYNEINTEPFNALKTMGDYQALANAQQQNQLLKTQNQAAQVGLSKDQAELGMQQYGYLNKVIGDLSAKASSKAGISQNEMISTAHDALMAGIIPKDQFNSFVGSLGEDTPQNNATTIANLQYKIQDAAKQHAITYGMGVTADNGEQKLYGVQQDPQMGGGVNIATKIANATTPAEKMAITADIKNNQKVSVPNSVRFTNTGDVNPNYSSDDTGPRPAGWNNATDPGKPSLPNGVQKTEYKLGDPEAAAAVGNIAGQNLANDITSLNHSPETLFQMEQASRALQNAPTGKGSEWRNSIKSYATAFAPEVFKDTDWKNDVHAYDEATKYLTSQAQRLASQVGPKTNENLSTAMNGSPNTSIDNLSAREIQGVLTGLTRLNYARTADFTTRNPNGTPQEYQAYGKDFNKSVDPRGFMVDVMPKEQLAKVLKELGPTTLPNGQPNPKRREFDNAVTMAVKYGFMKMPGSK